MDPQPKNDSASSAQTQDLPEYARQSIQMADCPYSPMYASGVSIESELLNDPDWDRIGSVAEP